MLKEFSDVFSGKPNLTHVTTHMIDTGEALPIHSSPYKVPQKLKEEVNKEIEKMLQLGIIRLLLLSLSQMELLGFVLTTGKSIK